MSRKKAPVGRPNRLRFIREAAGVKRADLAKFLGVSWKHVYLIEEGRQNPSIDMLLRIRGMLGCTLEGIYPPEKIIQMAATRRATSA